MVVKMLQSRNFQLIIYPAIRAYPNNLFTRYRHVLMSGGDVSFAGRDYKERNSSVAAQIPWIAEFTPGYLAEPYLIKGRCKMRQLVFLTKMHLF